MSSNNHVFGDDGIDRVDDGVGGVSVRMDFGLMRLMGMVGSNDSGGIGDDDTVSLLSDDGDGGGGVICTVGASGGCSCCIVVGAVVVSS